MGGSEMKGGGSSTWHNSPWATNCIKPFTTCHHVGFLPLTALGQGKTTHSHAQTVTHTYLLQAADIHTYTGSLEDI